MSSTRLLTGGEASDDARGFGAAGAGFDCVSAQNQPMVVRVDVVVEQEREDSPENEILDGELK